MIFNTFVLLLSMLLLICSNSNTASITALPDGKTDHASNPNTIIINYHVQNHAQKYFNSKKQLNSTPLGIIKDFCFDYYKYILSKESSAKNINVTKLLQTQMETFWKPENIKNILKFQKQYQNVPLDLETITNNFKALEFKDKIYSLFNKEIQASINEHINLLRKTYLNSLVEFYEDINDGGFLDSINNDKRIDIDCSDLCPKICETFLKKVSGATMDIMGPNFFNRIITQFLVAFGKKQYLSIDMLKPNINVMENFFQSIIDNNIVFFGCVEYIKSLEEQKYPDCIKFKLKPFISDKAVTYYEQRLIGKTELSPDEKLEQIQKEAMTIISQELYQLFKEKIRIKKPTLMNDALEDLTDSLQCAIFNCIEYEDYPQLEKCLDNVTQNLEQNRSYSKEEIIILVNETFANLRSLEENVPKIKSKPPLIKDLDDIEPNDSESDSDSDTKSRKVTGGSFKLGKDGSTKNTTFLNRLKKEETFESDSDRKILKSKTKVAGGSCKLGGDSSNNTNFLKNLEEKELFQEKNDSTLDSDRDSLPSLKDTTKNQEEQKNPPALPESFGLKSDPDPESSDSDSDSDPESSDSDPDSDPDSLTNLANPTLGNTKTENPKEQKNPPAANQLNFLKRLYKQYQTLSPLKKIIGTVTLVATFLLFATLIQKKYQLIH